MEWNIGPGSAIAVVAPAGPFALAPYRAGLAILASRFRVVHDAASHPAPDARLPYLAGDDEARARRLNQALADPAVQAVFFARGGYGCMRLLGRLDGDALTRRRLPLVGFSDITALHAWAARLGVPSVHGPVVTQLGRLPAAQVQACFDLLAGTAAPRLAGLRPLAGGRARGRLLGGNLTVLTHLCGTGHLPDLGGAILLLEEVNEAPYRLDRMLTHLALAGVLGRVAGVVVGSLRGCEGPGEPPPDGIANRVLEDRLGRLGVPVLTGAPVGHGDENLALPLGVEAQLDAAAGTLTFEEG